MTLFADAHSAVVNLSDATDQALIDATRGGDSAAYAALYERHHEAVRRLARRLTTSNHETDDVVSEVFANTLRAIRHGRGPTDDFGAYALRSVRNTITKLRTRTDTAHASPTENEHLDRPNVDDPFRTMGDAERAFLNLPDRFQQVLWSTEIEGATPTELSDRIDLQPGAISTLSQRARRALGRSYLVVKTTRLGASDECKKVRGLLPSYIQDQAAASTATRIQIHLAYCDECELVLNEMRDLSVDLRSTGWFALLAGVGRGVGSIAKQISAPTAATAAAAPAVAALIAGAVLLSADEPSVGHALQGDAYGVATIEAVADAIEVAPTEATTPDTASDAIAAAVSTTTTTSPSTTTTSPSTTTTTVAVQTEVASPAAPKSSRNTETAAAAQPEPAPATPPAVTEVAKPADNSVGPVDTVADVVDDAVGTVTDVTVAVAATVDEATDAVDETVGEVTDAVDDTVDAVTDVVHDTVDNVVDLVDPNDSLDPLTDIVLGDDGLLDGTVDTVTDVVDDTVTGTLDAVTDTVDTLLAPTTPDSPSEADDQPGTLGEAVDGLIDGVLGDEGVLGGLLGG